MGIACDKHSGSKDREKSKKPMNNVIPDSRNTASSATNISTWPPIRPANNEKTEHDGHAKSSKRDSSITSAGSSEVMEWTASKKAEEVESTSERQGYKGEHKQQRHKVNEGIGHSSQIHNAATKTSCFQVEAGSVILEESVLNERIVPAKRGKSNNQRTDSEAVQETRESNTARVDGMSNTNGSKKDTRKDFLTARNDNEGNTSKSGNSTRDESITDPGPSHSRNEANEEKENDSLSTKRCTEDLCKKPIKKGHNKRKIRELEDHVAELIEEKNKLLNRLSEIGAMKLINNNPNITDLSDDNRPEKLADQFSELYDNEWTDAYEHLTKTQAKPIDQSVNLLLQALKEAYKICFSSTTKRAIKLRKAMLSYAGLSDEDSIEIELLEIEKKMWEYRTKMSQRNVTRLGKEVRERLRDQLKQLETEASTSVSLYIDGCVRICWYMCIKKPPMHLDFGENEKSTTADNSKPVNRYFNKTKFTSYTKHGDYIDYVVWPALFLHDNGPIMKKGVAQGAPVITNVLLDVIDEN